MFNRYFQQELANLRDLAVEFSKAHPALAPMLEGPTTDPDVERLLEGVAFLSGLMREKLDDEFPEIIQGLMQLVFPHYLRPLPSSTIIAFAPKPSLKDTFTAPAGVSVASVPVDGTKCVFKTCYDVVAHPLNIRAAYYEQPAGRPPSYVLAMELVGPDLSNWEADYLRFHLAQDYPTAANIYYLLMKHLRGVSLTPAEGGKSCYLGPESVAPVGFADDEGMLPYPPQSFPGYRLLQEYFILPQKFLFFDVKGLDRWRDRGGGSRFNVTFELKDLPFPAPKVKRESFVLFATPAINAFEHEADPILLDHKKNEYRVRTSGQDRDHFQVYSVDEVVGYRQGTVRPRVYDAFDLFHAQSSQHPIYHVSFKRSPIGNYIDAVLSFTYPPESGQPAPETLSIRLTCTNGELAERLQIGDVKEPTSTSPEILSYKNIRPPTASVLPPLGKGLLWRFLSLYSLNYLSLANSENIKALLKLYIFSESRDQASVYANTRRVDGLQSLEVNNADRLVRGYLMRGQDITVKIQSDHFASEGDLFLFGSVLDGFFSSYASLNSYTSFKIEEVLKGDSYKWPAKIGDRPLI